MTQNAKRFVVDTCGWIEWLEGSSLAESFKPYCEAPADLIVPTAIVMELYKWAHREEGLAQALKTHSYLCQGQVVPLDNAIAIAAANASINYDLSFADAVIYATALQENAVLLTCDAHFKNLPNVELYPKSNTTSKKPNHKLKLIHSQP